MRPAPRGPRRLPSCAGATTRSGSSVRGVISGRQMRGVTVAVSSTPWVRRCRSMASPPVRGHCAQSSGGREGMLPRGQGEGVCHQLRAQLDSVAAADKQLFPRGRGGEAGGEQALRHAEPDPPEPHRPVLQPEPVRDAPRKRLRHTLAAPPELTTSRTPSTIQRARVPARHPVYRQALPRGRPGGRGARGGAALASSAGGGASYLLCPTRAPPVVHGSQGMHVNGGRGRNGPAAHALRAGVRPHRPLPVWSTSEHHSSVAAMPRRTRRRGGRA